jgi:hypothetical protein
MKKLIWFVFGMLQCCLLIAQQTPPSGLKSTQGSVFVRDSSGIVTEVWMYKGSVYGYNKLYPITSGGGSSNLTSNLTINIVGDPFHKNGTTYNSGTSIEAMLHNLLSQQPPPSVTASSSSPNINLPTNSVTLTGTATPSGAGTISSVLWSYVSGPSPPTIGGSTTNTASVTNLVEGNYVFRYTATDNLNQVSRVDINQSVTYVLPIVSAGNNQTLTSPTNSTTLNGSVSNGSYNIATTTWSQISGPNTVTFSSTSTLTPTVSGLIVGTYVLKLLATDVNNRTNFSTVTITVNAAAILVQYAFPTTSDQYMALQTADNQDYVGSYSPASNSADWLLDWHAMPQNSFCVIRVLTGTLIRNYYFDSGNPSFNNDTIPGSNCRTFTIRGYDYYTFYTPQNFDTGVNSRATFQHQ